MIALIIIILLLLILLSYIECDCNEHGTAWQSAGGSITLTCPTGQVIASNIFAYINVGEQPGGNKHILFNKIMILILIYIIIGDCNSGLQFSSGCFDNVKDKPQISHTCSPTTASSCEISFNLDSWLDASNNYVRACTSLPTYYISVKLLCQSPPPTLPPPTPPCDAGHGYPLCSPCGNNYY